MAGVRYGRNGCDGCGGGWVVRYTTADTPQNRYHPKDVRTGEIDREEAQLIAKELRAEGNRNVRLARYNERTRDDEFSTSDIEDPEHHSLRYLHAERYALAGARIPPFSAFTPKQYLQHAYHVTTKEALEDIRREGLQPHSHEHLDEGDEAIFVERDEKGVDIYSDPGTVMLRFLVDGFGSTEDGEDVLYDVVVPPDQIEVRTTRGWKPLLKTASTDNLFGLK